MYLVHVQNKDGNTMDPTTRFGHVRRLLKEGKAVVIQRKPFTIRLTYQIAEPITHLYMETTDQDRTNIRNGVIRRENGTIKGMDYKNGRMKEKKA